ncbi:tryptophan 7-halogenase [Pseudooceanicola sp. CBS1P-1]|uniref:Tryptophan 7-halogenase n=1 Tax=Pseudooceanicola albus TaxID=2692189 RepID=A0A6L7G8E2_9RHOB|nr:MULTISPECIES: tryptophan halogenase family protein [Pseudooceanicola]MBT9384350.1 tryptophan 7-halogenase [Pseudooceanicola endophyticus]MXN19912.1 tryptophan 7-halogenase [Pseudooceanicola albus]
MRVVIVGGGSAGWIAAATLQAHLNGTGPGPVSISVVESPDTPRIGVGEATIPTFRDMLRRFGLSERAFLSACDASFKHGIRFDDWSGPGTRCLHPFHRHALPRDIAARWLESDGRTPFAEIVSAQPALIDAGRAPRAAGGPDFSGPIPYAYHLDAEKFAEHLAGHLAGRGVHRISLHVQGIERDENGLVTALSGADGTRLEADLWIDCTGFRALLNHDGGWISYRDRLLCDRAVTLRIPEPERSFTPAPFTRARALSAGWSWDIGLRQRRGRGYVYASAHLSDDDAEAELRAEEGPKAKGQDARVIHFDPGRRAAPWQGNVVAIGLAAGFLEPLESTGLYLADYAARVLCEMFPAAPGHPMAPLARRYNQLLGEMHDDLADFLGLHYAVAQRRDTSFWRAAPLAARRSDRLAHLLELWELRPPSFADFSQRFSPFSHAAWEFILLGMGWRPEGLPPGPLPCPAPMETLTRQMLNQLPHHGMLLRRLAPEPA